MDTNAHVLTQREFQLQCECVKNDGKMTISDFGRVSDMDTNAHMLEKRFRKLLLMIMHVLCNKMIATSAHRYCSSWKVTQLDENKIASVPLYMQG